MIPKFFHLKGFTKKDRNTIINTAKEAIMNSGGWIIDFKYFSNVAFNFLFELPICNIEKLYVQLSNIELNLADESRQQLIEWCEELRHSDNNSNKDNSIGTLNITFIHKEPDLRIECPSIPG